MAPERSGAHCTSTPTDALKGILCTGDPNSGTVPVGNVIGTARFIVWLPDAMGSCGFGEPSAESVAMAHT